MIDVNLEENLINVLKQENKLTVMLKDGEILEEIFFNDKNAISKCLNWRLIFAKVKNMHENLFELCRKGDLIFKFSESKENYLVFEMSEKLAPLYKKKLPKEQGKSTISKIILTEKNLKIVLDGGNNINYNLLDPEHIERVIKFTVNVSEYSHGLHRGLIKRPSEKDDPSKNIINEDKANCV